MVLQDMGTTLEITGTCNVSRGRVFCTKIHDDKLYSCVKYAINVYDGNDCSLITSLESRDLG